MDGADELELVIGPPAHGGHCVAREDGRVIFVRHALPGERVRATVTQRTSRYWRADAVQILDASPDRVPSVWPQAGAGGVGGGELAHVALPAQRTWKQQVVGDALVRIGRLGPDHQALAGFRVLPAPGPAAATGLGYRTRVTLVADGAGRAGMHRHRSHEVLAVSGLPLADERIAGLGLLERQWEPGTRIQAVAPSHSGALVLTDASRTPRVRERVDTGAGRFTYRVRADGFWQVHSAAPAVLIDAVLQAADLTGGERVLELYSGAGLLTQPLAVAVGSRGHVHAVEGDADAVRDARRNAHDLTQITLHAGDVAGVLRSLMTVRTDVVVLDPPRAGAGKDVTARILTAQPRTVVYVACDPAALARDVALLGEGGYALTALAGFDLFPHTHHVECVATLARR